MKKIMTVEGPLKFHSTPNDKGTMLVVVTGEWQGTQFTDRVWVQGQQLQYGEGTVIKAQGKPRSEVAKDKEGNHIKTRSGDFVVNTTVFADKLALIGEVKPWQAAGPRTTQVTTSARSAAGPQGAHSDNGGFDDDLPF